MVVFDTEVVDLTDHLQDPVDVLFGTQLGGGTDIDRAVGYCQRLMTLAVADDLHSHFGPDRRRGRRAVAPPDGGNHRRRRHDDLSLGPERRRRPCYDERLAAKMSALGSPAFACTPDLFPDLMAAAIQKRDLAAWAARHEIVVRASG